MTTFSVFTAHVALAAAAGLALVSAPAHAAAVRECTSRGTWTFDQPLTNASVSGTASLSGATVCLRYTTGGGFTTESYTAGLSFDYTGNCQLLVLSAGTSLVGAVVNEDVIVYDAPADTSTSGLHVVTAHPHCSGATTLTTMYHWAHVAP